jgi:hypothetical protein
MITKSGKPKRSERRIARIISKPVDISGPPGDLSL